MPELPSSWTAQRISIYKCAEKLLMEGGLSAETAEMCAYYICDDAAFNCKPHLSAIADASFVPKKGDRVLVKLDGKEYRGIVHRIAIDKNSKVFVSVKSGLHGGPVAYTSVENIHPGA